MSLLDTKEEYLFKNKQCQNIPSKKYQMYKIVFGQIEQILHNYTMTYPECADIFNIYSKISQLNQ